MRRADDEFRVWRENEANGARLDAERREIKSGAVKRETGGDESRAADEVTAWRVGCAGNA